MAGTVSILARSAAAAAVAAMLGTASASAAPSNPPAGQLWGNGQSTQGAHLQLVEVERRALKAGEHVPFPYKIGSTLVVYRLRATGLTQGKPYDLWLHLAFENPANTHEVVEVDARGDVTRQGGPVTLPVMNYRKGEPVGAGLISPDGAVRAIGRAFPFPLQATDGPCHLTLELLDPAGTTFGAVMRGFRPGSVVETVSRSGREVLRSRHTVPPGGTFNVDLRPAAAGGDQQARFTARGPDCQVKVDYAWGAASMAAQ